jgi:hypothetical protein
MYAIVLIAILAVLLVFGIILWWRWPRKKSDLGVEFGYELDFEVDKLESASLTATGTPTNSANPQIPLVRSNDWSLHVDPPVEPHKDLTTLTDAEEALFDATRSHSYWKKFTTSDLFIIELYRMESECMRRAFKNNRETVDLARVLKIKAYLAKIIKPENIQSVNMLAGNISIGEKVYFTSMVDASTPLVEVVTVDEFQKQLDHIINFCRNMTAFTKAQQNTIETMPAAHTYGMETLEQAYGGLDHHVEKFFQDNLRKITTADRDVRGKAVEMLSDPNKFDDHNPCLALLAKLGLSRYFARVLSDSS